MKEYIEREAARDLIEAAWMDDWNLSYSNDRLDEIPAADVVEQKHGSWQERIVNDDCDKYGLFRRRFYCSACGDWNMHGASKYCPNCGAKMDGGGER